MSVSGLIHSAWLLYFSQPAVDRAIYQAIRGKTIHSVVELGIGGGVRLQRLAEMLGANAANLPLRYTGIDLFEARPASAPGLSLKQAFQELRPPQVQVKLVPGDPYSALLRTANSLAGTDLVIISADQDQDALERAWQYLPRMLHPKSLVFREEGEAGQSKTRFRALSAADVGRLATAAKSSSRRAA